ncbi:MAG: DUF6488 family protein [Pseudomonadota bacterium]
MMKKLISVFALFFMLQASNILAHGGGHGPISQFKAVTIALDAADQFTNLDPGLGFGKLDSSWKGLSRDTSTIATKGKGYYIVSVENKAQGKTLYILMSASGDIYDANFTGEFPKVK